MLDFEPKDRPTAEQALVDPYFRGLAKVEREPSAQPVTKMEFEFERRRITKEDVGELIYREILEYHPKMLKELMEGSEPIGFMYPSVIDHFKKQFAYLEEHYGNGTTGAPLDRQHASLPRQCVVYSDKSAHVANTTEDLSKCTTKDGERPSMDRNAGMPMSGLPQHVPHNVPGAISKPGKVIGSVLRYGNCGVAAASEAVDQRRMIRNSPAQPQYIPADGSYPRRSPNIRSEKGGNEGIESSNGMQPKPHYLARKMAAAAAEATTQDSARHQWY